MTTSNEKHNDAWDEETDLVIVGAGDAGLAAAIESLDAGSSAIVFEKMASVKSTSSAMAGGVIAFAGTEYQRQHGVQDSNEQFFQDLIKIGKGKNWEPLVKVFLNEQLDTYNWLTALGIKWERLGRAPGGSVARGHHTDPVLHVQLLQQAAEKRGAKIFFKTKVTELVTDKNKRVIGVCAQSEKRAWRVKARKGVVLATGGFGYDRARMAAIGPGFDKIKVIVSPGHTGDGHGMAEALGGRFMHMQPDYLRPSIGIHVSSKSAHSSLPALSYGAIVVNKLGSRFVDESLESRSLGTATQRQPDQIVFEIFDQKVLDSLHSAEGAHAREAAVKRLIKAETVAELASKIAVPPEALKKTLARYNDYADKGQDADFGRTHLTQAGGALTSIDSPPFYAFETSPSLVGTYGGIAVDEEMHALSNDGIIPGLFGAGEIVGGFHGAGYHTGSALAKALVFGRIAGRNCAAGR